MPTKMNKPQMFTVDLSWVTNDKGVIHSPSAKESIFVTTPAEFGGTGAAWNPELLFLSAVTSCYMSTYLLFVKKLKFENAGFECSTTGQAEVVDGKYKFTYIHIYPKAYVTNEDDIEKAQLAMEKTKKYCLISNSINAEIIQHPEIAVTKPETMITTLKKTA